MADEKMITQFDAATTLADTDIMPCVDGIGGTPATKKITVANLKTLFAGTGLTTSYVGLDPAARSYAISALTRNNTFQDMDVSGVVPAGASAVLLNGYYYSATNGGRMDFRPKGSTQTTNTVNVHLRSVGSTVQPGLVIVALDANRIIEYRIANADGDGDLTVRGYWL
jgi:hypothetical protein